MKNSFPSRTLLIAIFRSRAGSPTGADVSGTIEEIREFMRQGKYVAVYFYEGDVSIETVDPDQLRTIRQFKQEIQQYGLTESYKTVEELSAKLPNHLTAIVGTLVANPPTRTAADQSGKPLSVSPPPVQPPTPSFARPAPDTSRLVVGDSGRWLLLDTKFYEGETIRQTATGEWVAEIQSTNAEDDAHLGGLKPHHFGRSRPVAFAHRNDGFLVTVKSVESVSQGGQQVWIVTLIPEDIQYGGSVADVAYQATGKLYTPDDFARLRAGRILLNDPPPLKDNDRQAFDRMNEIMLESFIRGSNNPVSVGMALLNVTHSHLTGKDVCRMGSH